MSLNNTARPQQGGQAQSFSSKPIPLLRQRSYTGTERRSLDLPLLGLDPTQPSTSASRKPTPTAGFGSAKAKKDPRSTAKRNDQQPGADLDAQWIEMQNTLGEVERSGASGGASVFSSSHALALEDLRNAQIALAQAWARTEAEDVDADGDITDTGKTGGAAGGTANVLAGDRMEGTKQKTNESGSARNKDGRTKLEEETENDIALARKRRAANDRYFERVNKGVVDVVDKLEAVARKMRGVEMESKEIWGSDDTFETDSMTG